MRPDDAKHTLDILSPIFAEVKNSIIKSGETSEASDKELHHDIVLQLIILKKLESRITRSITQGKIDDSKK